MGRRTPAGGIRPDPARPARGGRSARRPAHQGHPRRRRRPVGPRALGREVRRARRRRRRTSARGWGSSSSPGRTSRRCTTACSSSRTPDTTRRASSSTPGTSTVRTPDRRPRVRSAAPHHRRRAQRRRRAGGRDAVRGHGPSAPVLRRRRVRPDGHDRRPCVRPAGTARGASRSCPTSTDHYRSARRSAVLPQAPDACWSVLDRNVTRAMWLTAYRTRCAVAAAISPSRRRRPGPSR